MTDLETYLASVAAQVRGAGAGRLNVELRGHVEDSIAHHVASGHDPAEAARIALEQLGSADELLVAWKLRERARRVRARRRAAFVAFAVATASALAVVQLASGHRPPRHACTHHTTSTLCGPRSN